MENQQEAMNMMMIMFERMQQEQRAMSEMKAAVERLLRRNGEFNGKGVSRYLREYKAEMMQYRIPEGLQVISFSRVASDELQERIHKIQQQNSTWESFEEALREAYDYERWTGRDRREFDEWVASEKTHRSATQAFLEFEHRFARLSERERRLVGGDKVLMFVRSIDRKERMDIGIELEDDDGANGLTEDWAKVERVCRRHDERKLRISSTTTWPMKDGRLRKNDEANMKAEIQHDGTTGERVEQDTHSSCERTMAKDKADNSSVEGNFGIQVPETSGQKGVSIIDVCIIDADKECEADVIKEVATKDEIESEVAMDESMADCHIETSPPLIPETPAVAIERQRETEETEGGGEKTNVEADEYDEEIAEKNAKGETTKEGNTEDSCQQYLETSAVVSENQRETGETGDGGEEGKVGSRFGWKMIHPKFQSKRKCDNAEVGSTTGEARNTEHALRRIKKRVLWRIKKHALRREKKHALQPHEDRTTSTYRRTYVANNGKKCRKSNRTRQVKTKKRKQIRTKRKEKKPTRKSTESVKTDQPSPDRPNTNRKGSRTKRKTIRRDRIGSKLIRLNRKSEKKSRLMKKRKRARKDTTADDKDQAGHAKSERRLWWIGCRQWFGWKEWMCSKWRDKVNITREVEGTTSRQRNQSGRDRTEETNKHQQLRHIPEDVRVWRG